MRTIRLMGGLFVLFLSLSMGAQTAHLVLPNRTVEIIDGGKNFGKVSYQIYVVGGNKIGDNRFDFSGASHATLRLDIKCTPKRKKYKKNIVVGVLSQQLEVKKENAWRSKDEQIFVNLDDAFSSYFFQVEQSGEIDFPVLFFSYIDKSKTQNWLNEPDWTLVPGAKGIYGVKLIISGLESEKELRWKDLQSRNNIFEILDFVLSPEGAEYRLAANSSIGQLVESKVRALEVTDNSLAATKAFVKQFELYTDKGFPSIDRAVAIAKKRIVARQQPVVTLKEDGPQEPPDPTPLELAESAWGQALGRRDTLLLQAYLAEYAGIIPVNDTMALDSLTCWSPASFTPLARRGRREQIQLRNFLIPAYYDIYQGRLAIDDGLLQEEHRLSIDVLLTEKFSLTIVDKGCPYKTLEIPLDNLMSAGLSADTTLGVYTFTFTGGNPPYALQLTPADGDGPGWLRQQITTTAFRLTQDSLQAAGLEGTYRASAYSKDSNSPVAITGPVISVAAQPRPSWVLPLLLVLAVGGVALLLLFILRNGKPRQRTIFEEG